MPQAFDSELQCVHTQRTYRLHCLTLIQFNNDGYRKFIHLFNSYLLKIYCKSGTVRRAEKSIVRKGDTTLAIVKLAAW